MFLSVIISCHNCEKYIKRVLNSLVIQNFEDMEVIISDDQSTDNFMDIVKKYDKILDIKYFKTGTHKYHCPGNTRLDGLSHASGEWVTFMDHDDAFIANAFNNVYSSVKAYEANGTDDLAMAFSPVQKVGENGEQLLKDGQPIKLLDAVTWLHGNFYKRSFLEKYNINFKEDLFGNEDLFFNNRVQAEIAGNELKILNFSVPLYNWFSNPQSLSNLRKGDDTLDYTEKYFADYLCANSEPHIMGYKAYPKMHEKFRLEMMHCLMFSYIYYQRALYMYKNRDVLKDMYDSIKDTYGKICDTLGVRSSYVVDFMMEDQARFNSARQTISELSGPFIESESMIEFFTNLEK